MTPAVAAPTGTPVYTHDCGPDAGCTYLGTFTPPADYAPPGVAVVDLWAHRSARHPDRVSLIYRWADDGPEYESFPYDPLHEAAHTMIERHPVFAEVLARLDRADR